MTHRPAVPAALLLGLFAATPASAATPPRLPAPSALPTAAVPATPVAACRTASPSAGRAAPAAVTEAFGILRRPRTADDALPTTALRALRRAGLDVPDPAVARRLRQAGRGTAWIVPVADLRPLLAPVRCLPRAPRPPRARRVPARPAPATATAPPAPAPAAPPVPAPSTPAPPLLTAPVMPAPVLRGPQPGVVVVARGDVLGGGGGTLRALQRGLAAPVVTPCAGPRDDLVGVSGVVPDGVDAVYLTTTDGSAVRADVADNGYAFHVPPPPRTAMRVPRYVVWSGRDGVPHVQQVLLPRMPDRACTAYQRGIASRLALDPAAFPPLVVVPAAPPRAPSPARVPRRP